MDSCPSAGQLYCPLVTEEGFPTLDGSAALLGYKLSLVIIKLGLG